MPKLKSKIAIKKKYQRFKLLDDGTNKIKFNSFFAGIGGFDLGFEQVGISPAFHCEINNFCKSVLSRHWPDLPNADDITLLDIVNIPDAEVWCGGFPCQDVSVARGSQGRNGLRGANSGLFYPFLELIKKKLPEVVLLENVTGLLNSHQGQDFGIILNALTEIGYGVAWRVLNARYFGAPQSRPRVFICAWKNRVDLALNVLFEKENGAIIKNERKGFVTPSKCTITGATVPLVGYCLAATSGRHTGTDWSRTYVSYFNKVRRLTPIECEGLQGFPTGWSLPEEDYPLCDDEIDTLRYHSIGNAVCVQVVKWLGERIVSGLSGNFTNLNIIDFDNHQNIAKTAASFSDFCGANADKLHKFKKGFTSNDQYLHWKNGGAAFNGWFLEANVSPAPHVIIENNLINVIEKCDVDPKYYLSPNAAKGILRRVDSQGRTLFQPLYIALERLSNKLKLFESHSNKVCA